MSAPNMGPTKQSIDAIQDAIGNSWSTYNDIVVACALVVDAAHRDGYAAALAALREPSDELLAAVRAALPSYIPILQHDLPRALCAAADALAKDAPE